MAAYVLVIFGFAIIFASLPGQNFYAPYVDREGSAAVDRENVEAEISKAITESINFTGIIGQHVDDHRPVYAVDIRRHDDTRIEFSLNRIIYESDTRFQSGKYTRYANYIEQSNYELLLDKSFEYRYFDKLGTCYAVIGTLPDWGDSPQDPKKQVEAYDLLFGTKISQETGIKSSPSICFWEPQRELLHKFQRSSAGDPRAASGFFERMAYFSVVTITTTGYGDIVPLTNSARLAVAIEAVLGWILAGLFLNAVASQRSPDTKN